MTTIDTDRLAALVAAKSQVAELLVRLAQRQLELATGGQTQALLKLLAAKQSILDQLNHLEREIDPFRAQDPEARPWRTPADRAACQQHAQRASQLLAQAVTLEQQGEAVMVRRREAVAVELSAAQSAADARSAYAPQPARTTAPSALQFEG
jgi:hypothetical protein